MTFDAQAIRDRLAERCKAVAPKCHACGVEVFVEVFIRWESAAVKQVFCEPCGERRLRERA